MTDGCVVDTAEFREFDSRLTQLEGRMGAVEDTLAKHGGLLLDIKSAVTEERAARGPGVLAVIHAVSSIALTCGLIAGLLVYVAASVMSAPVTSVTERQADITRRLTRIEHLDIEFAAIQQRVSSIEQRINSQEFVKGWQAIVDNSSQHYRR